LNIPHPCTTTAFAGEAGSAGRERTILSRYLPKL
jgi:hypothetical protein